MPMHSLIASCMRIISSKPFSTACLHTSPIPPTPTPHHFILLLNQCTTLNQVNKIHAQITTLGLHKDPIITGKLVEISAVKLTPTNMYHAMMIFTHSQNPNLFTWNTIIRGFSISNTPLKALLIFILMRRKGIETESFTYAFGFKACARSNSVENGKAIHGVVVKNGQDSHIFVANTALHSYTACGDVQAAEKLFDEMGVRNIVTWNAMIAGYVQNGMLEDGLKVFDRMWILGIRPNDATMVSILSACSQKKDIGLGRLIHEYINENWVEFESNVNVFTALMDMYAKCRCMNSARQVFKEARQRDLGMWNALIGGCVFNRCFSEALELFRELQVVGLDPDEPTLVSALCACAHLGALDVGKNIHSFANKKRFTFNTALGTAFIEMYSKCGCIDKALEVFNKTPRKDIMTWTAMIGGLALHGHAKDALELFSSMRKSGTKPDGITFVGVLCACSHAGFVDEGLRYYKTMQRDYGIVPKIEHCGCIIDLLSRAGRLWEAFEFIRSMEIQPNAIIWRTLLGACREHLNVELAETALMNLLQLRCDHCGDYVLLANIYASTGRWDDAEKIRKQMKEGGIRKIPGLSLIETDSKQRLEMHVESCSTLNKQLAD